MKPAFLLAIITAAAAYAQFPPPNLSENTTRVSDHVQVILGFPNIAIVTGDRATLVVDTGLGPSNGATVARVAKRLSKGQKLFLTTTHFHPEHAAGEGGFPADTVLIRNAVQQQEMVEHGTEMLTMFSRLCRTTRNFWKVSRSFAGRMWSSITRYNSISAALQRDCSGTARGTPRATS